MRPRPRLEVVRKELRALREERTACRSYLERYRTLQPVRAQLRRIEGFEEEAGDPKDLDGLPPNPEERLAQLESTLRETEERLAASAQEMREPRARLETFGDREERIVRRAETIRAFEAHVATIDAERVRRAQVDQEIRDLERRARALSVELFATRNAVAAGRHREAFRGELREAVRSVPESRARRGARRRRRSGSSIRGSTVRATRACQAARRSPCSASCCSRSVSCEAACWRRRARVPVLAAGVALLVLGTGHQRQQRASSAVAASAPTRRRRPKRRCGGRRPRSWKGLGIKPSALQEPDMELVSSLERLQALLRDQRDRESSLQGPRCPRARSRVENGRPRTRARAGRDRRRIDLCPPPRHAASGRGEPQSQLRLPRGVSWSACHGTEPAWRVRGKES